MCRRSVLTGIGSTLPVIVAGCLGTVSQTGGSDDADESTCRRYLDLVVVHLEDDEWTDEDAIVISFDDDRLSAFPLLQALLAEAVESAPSEVESIDVDGDEYDVISTSLWVDGIEDRNLVLSLPTDDFADANELERTINGLTPPQQRTEVVPDAPYVQRDGYYFAVYAHSWEECLD